MTAMMNQIKSEENHLDDLKQLSQALLDRERKLQSQTSNASRPREAGRQLLKKKHQRKNELSAEVQEIRSSLASFITDHLAPMVAAEEAGGPVVGEMAEVPRGAVGAEAPTSKRQSRIDEIWGGRRDMDTRDVSEVDAAAQEIDDLVNNLLASILGDSSGTHVDLPRDSAIARFLVRAQVAQYHPRDARKLRLVDFGRTVDNAE